MGIRGEHFTRWRCISCGEILDEVILENRQAGDRQEEWGIRGKDEESEQAPVPKI